ncbi:MAG: hypothetical protein KJ770_05455 [Actinobacteria bacterium]|nr:hypothetical protein [Actinomycetota bacterium]
MLTRNQKMLKEAANHTIMQKNLITMTEQVVEIIAMVSVWTRITMENVIIVTRLTAKIMVRAAKTMKTVLTKTKIKTAMKTAMKIKTAMVKVLITVIQTASGSEVKKRTKTTAEIASIIKFRTLKINSNYHSYYCSPHTELGYAGMLF